MPTQLAAVFPEISGVPLFLAKITDAKAVIFAQELESAIGQATDAGWTNAKENPKSASKAGNIVPRGDEKHKETGDEILFSLLALPQVVAQEIIQAPPPVEENGAVSQKLPVQASAEPQHKLNTKKETVKNSDQAPADLPRTPEQFLLKAISDKQGENFASVNLTPRVLGPEQKMAPAPTAHELRVFQVSDEIPQTNSNFFSPGTITKQVSAMEHVNVKEAAGAIAATSVQQNMGGNAAPIAASAEQKNSPPKFQEEVSETVSNGVNVKASLPPRRMIDTAVTQPVQDGKTVGDFARQISAAPDAGRNSQETDNPPEAPAASQVIGAMIAAAEALPQLEKLAAASPQNNVLSPVNIRKPDKAPALAAPLKIQPQPETQPALDAPPLSPQQHDPHGDIPVAAQEATVVVGKKIGISDRISAHEVHDDSQGPLPAAKTDGTISTAGDRAASHPVLNTAGAQIPAANHGELAQPATSITSVVPQVRPETHPLQTTPSSSKPAVTPPSADSAEALKPGLDSVQMARFVDRQAQSEMHLGIRTEAFGSVQIHTVIRDNLVGLSVGNERGDLKTFLGPEVPGLQNNLQQQHDLRFEDVRFLNGGLASGGNPYGGADAHARSFQQGHSLKSTQAWDGVAELAQEPEMEIDQQVGISVHA